MAPPPKLQPARKARPVTDAEVAFRSFWQTAARLRRLAEVRYATWGLSPAQWRVLRHLHEQAAEGNRTLRATDLCILMLLNKATVSGLVARLLRMGLVTRSPLELDQRAHAVTLTPAGRRLVATILVDHPEWMRELMSGLTPAEQRSLAGTLGKLRQWLEPLVERTGTILPGPVRSPAPLRKRGATRRTRP